MDALRGVLAPAKCIPSKLVRRCGSRKTAEVLLGAWLEDNWFGTDNQGSVEVQTWRPAINSTFRSSNNSLTLQAWTFQKSKFSERERERAQWEARRNEADVMERKCKAKERNIKAKGQKKTKERQTKRKENEHLNRPLSRKKYVASWIPVSDEYDKPTHSNVLSQSFAEQSSSIWIVFRDGKEAWETIQVNPWCGWPRWKLSLHKRRSCVLFWFFWNGVTWMTWGLRSLVVRRSWHLTMASLPWRQTIQPQIERIPCRSKYVVSLFLIPCALCKRYVIWIFWTSFLPGLSRISC